MESRQKKTRIRRFFASRLFLILSLVVAILIALGYARAYYQDYQIKEEIRELEQEVGRLETKKLESLEILKYVMSDAFVEEKARTELNMRKPGEQLVVIDREEQNITVDDDAKKEMPFSNPHKWRLYFFGSD